MTGRAGELEFLAPGQVAPDDDLDVPRRMAAAIVAQANPAPGLVVDVGSFRGEVLEAFLDQFPHARGQWVDASDRTLAIARERLSRFGDRVVYRVGCPGRDVADGTVPAGADVITTSWVSHHRDRAGVDRFYADAVALLAPGGWLVNLDHVTAHDDVWQRRLAGAREALGVPPQGPPLHHDAPLPGIRDHVAGLEAAGLTDFDLVWRSFTTCLFMGRRAG